MDHPSPNHAAFCRIYNGNVDAIRRYFYRRLPATEVDDAAAETFLVVWKRIDEAPAGDEVVLWLYGIARNVSRNLSRSRRRTTRLRARLRQTPLRVEPDAAAQVVRRIEDQEVVDAVAGLRPRDREVLRLAAWEGLKPAEIAAVLGIEPHTASVRLSRARNRLARAVGMPCVGGRSTRVPQPIGEEVEW